MIRGTPKAAGEEPACNLRLVFYRAQGVNRLNYLVRAHLLLRPRLQMTSYD